MQDQAWRDGAGDAYYQRNREHYAALPDDDLPLALIRKHRLPLDNVLEVGCATGARLAAIRQLGSREQGDDWYVGVDPSEEALAYGRQHFPGIQLHCDTAAEMEPYGCIRLAIVFFVLHWVSRATLFESIARIDRVVPDGGHLILGDFLPDRPTAVPYHHQPALYTYKQDYRQLFLASGLYREIETIVFNHDTRQVGDAPSHQRAFCALLRKESQYVETSRS